MSADLAARVAALKAGQRVRATYKGGTVVESTLERSFAGLAHPGLGHNLHFVDATGDGYPTTLQSVEVLPDPEPPVGSVVLDKDGNAWQPYPSGVWWSTVQGASGMWWGELLAECGPLSVIYTPGGAE